MTRAHVHIPPSAVFMIAGAVACFAVLDGTIKSLATRHPVPLLVWARWGFQVLAMVFLNERMTLPRMAFVLAGLSGMLMIVQPGAELFKGASLLALGSAGCYAVYQITTRMLAGEDPRVSLFYPALVGTLLMTFVWPWFGSRIDVTWTDVALLAGIGVLGTIGHFLFILAFQRAPASALTPFTYIQVVFATLIGWLVYDDFPDALTLAGMALIAGSGLLLTWHERRRALIAAPEPTAVD